MVAAMMSGNLKGAVLVSEVSENEQCDGCTVENGAVWGFAPAPAESITERSDFRAGHVAESEAVRASSVPQSHAEVQSGLQWQDETTGLGHDPLKGKYYNDLIMEKRSAGENLSILDEVGAWVQRGERRDRAPPHRED